MPDLGAFLLPIRAVQMLFAIILLGITAGAISAFNDTYGNGFDEIRYYGSPAQNNFMLFVSLWTILILIYLIAAITFMKSMHHPIVAVALDGLTALFYFAGFIALAVLAGGFRATVIFGVRPYQLLSAGAAFGAFQWILFVITTILSFMSSRDGSAGSGGGFRGFGTRKTAAGPSNGVGPHAGV